MNTLQRSAGLVASLIFSFFLTLGTALAGPATAVPPPSLLTPNQVHRIQSLAAVALEHAAQARIDSQQHHVPAIAEELNAARTLVDLIRAERPTAKAQALLQYLQFDLKEKDNTEALPDLLPIEQTLTQLGDAPSVQLARKQLEQVKQALEKSDRGSALTALENARKALTLDAVDFPLAAAEEDLHAAFDKLATEKTPADPDLISLEHNLLALVNLSIA